MIEKNVVTHYKGIFQDTGTQSIRRILLTISKINRLITNTPNEGHFVPVVDKELKKILGMIMIHMSVDINIVNCIE